MLPYPATRFAKNLGNLCGAKQQLAGVKFSSAGANVYKGFLVMGLSRGICSPPFTNLSNTAAGRFRGLCGLRFRYNILFSPFPKCCGRNIKLSSPVFLNHCFTVNRYKNVICSVSCLCVPICPSAIFWAVAFVDIDSVNRQIISISVSYCPSIEFLEIVPIFTNKDSASAIILIFFVLGE